VTKPTAGAQAIKSTRNVWFTERNENIALSLKHSGDKLYQFNSKYQKIEVFQTEALGKVLVLDGNIACAEEDEYVYHEMIAHVPVFAHNNPRRILVVGGGDGGTVRELVKHECIEHIDLVEIDESVIEASKLHFATLSKSLNHSKVSVIIEDGVKFVENCNSAQYDIVIVDSDNPEGLSKGLFSKHFYQQIYRILKPDGIMITQSESPRYNKDIFVEVFGCYYDIFSVDNVFCYLMYLPSYPSGMWSFSYSAKGGNHPFKGLDREKVLHFSEHHNLKYYGYDVHKSSFVLPKFVQDILR